MVYAQKDRSEYVRLLLEAGSVVNHRDEANLNSMLNLLYKSKRSGRGVTAEDLRIAEALIQSGYLLDDLPIRSSWHKYGGTAIKMAAEQGASELVELFLAHGANPDIPDDVGLTPILSAANNNVLSSAVVLLRHNCRTDAVGEVKVHQQATRQLSPLQCALVRRHFAVARLLVDCGATVCPLDRLAELDASDRGSSVSFEDCDFWLWYVARAANPASLFDLCVREVRRLLGRRVVAEAVRLPLPCLIQRCVRLDDVFEQYASLVDPGKQTSDCRANNV